jgi:hypothetical protein
MQTVLLKKEILFFVWSGVFGLEIALNEIGRSKINFWFYPVQDNVQ